ncbi:2-C-methyl-D-erythritol 4-phosphate cytidylyltransferase [Cellulomonas sp. PhB143]|uniref:IspD/TarI family cytidylyltransferase n=1 Tax=Cellulomonas sp. PhB143 TaxID=2485186 RepID=UPI000FC27143|nr:IspD/TarI family cytidylyltransferase [Cellulomonas sp. PhB143]ROS78797.1 2-C-methyl-D-erythritol 4-phosphate cytidylyltransferase [Cellulomonas sp. PhB143]
MTSAERPAGAPAPGVLAVLTAAGSGTRLGRGVPKALVELGGAPLVLHAARRLATSGVVDAIVVTAPAGAVDAVRALLADDADVTVPVHVVPGGVTRQASVAAALDAVPGQAPGAPGDVSGGAPLPGHGVVLVHDAARPLATPGLVRRVVAAVRAGHPAVVPALPVTDTVKRVVTARGGTARGGTARGGTAPTAVETVVATVPRDELRAVQTPQGFDATTLRAAHAGPGSPAPATDDAALVEALGRPVVLVPGEPCAMKITTEHDLRVATLFLEEDAWTSTRRT